MLAFATLEPASNRYVWCCFFDLHNNKINNKMITIIVRIIVIVCVSVLALNLIYHCWFNE